MEISPLLVLLLVWWVFGLLTSGKRGRERRQRRLPERPPARVPSSRPTAGESGGDATQQEGSRLERILRDFERALEEAEAQRRPEPAADPGWNASEEWNEEEDTPLLEPEEPRVRSLEEEVHRPEREAVAAGGDLEALHQGRLDWAEARNRALTLQDHRRFDERIRAPQIEEVDPTPPVSGRMRRLREGVIWRELLGPPVALRPPGER